MKIIINHIRALVDRYPLFWQFVKFCLVGVTNLTIYISVYWLLTRLLGFHYIPASVAGFVVSVSWSFFINLKWTFRSVCGSRHKQYIGFFAINVAGMLISLGLLTFFIEFWHFYDILAQFICAVIVSFFNFGLTRCWVFKKPSA